MKVIIKEEFDKENKLIEYNTLKFITDKDGQELPESYNIFTGYYYDSHQSGAFRSKGYVMDLRKYRKWVYSFIESNYYL